MRLAVLFTLLVPLCAGPHCFRGPLSCSEALAQGRSDLREPPALAALSAPGKAPPPVVMISIDGLKPDLVLRADHFHLKVPNLRRLLAEGTHASGVAGVLPTVTYPSHTTLVTGVPPRRHGILDNQPFDPTGKNLHGWYWYAEDIKAPTLWDAAERAGLRTASVDWPVTVGANISYNIVQYWRAETPDDKKLIRALSTRGLVAEAERALGPYPDGNDYTVAADRRRAAFAVYLLEKKRPRFLLCYFGGLDNEEHMSGPYSEKSLAALEDLDALVGLVRAAAERLGGGKAVVCLVSDHGFLPADKMVHLNALLQREKLIQLDDAGRVRSWQAYAWGTCGSAAIMISAPKFSDEYNEVQRKTRAILQRLTEERRSGIARFLESGEALRMGGFPGAAFVVMMRDGYEAGDNLTGPQVTRSQHLGTHGYDPARREMDSAFFIAGPGIPPGLDVGRIDSRDIAPTLAGLLHVPLPSAQGRDVLFTRPPVAAPGLPLTRAARY